MASVTLIVDDTNLILGLMMALQFLGGLALGISNACIDTQTSRTNDAKIAVQHNYARGTGMILGPVIGALLFLINQQYFIPFAVVAGLHIMLVLLTKGLL